MNKQKLKEVILFLYCRASGYPFKLTDNLYQNSVTAEFIRRVLKYDKVHLNIGLSPNFDVEKDLNPILAEMQNEKLVREVTATYPVRDYDWNIINGNEYQILANILHDMEMAEQQAQYERNKSMNTQKVKEVILYFIARAALFPFERGYSLYEFIRRLIKDEKMRLILGINSDNLKEEVDAVMAQMTDEGLLEEDDRVIEWATRDANFDALECEELLACSETLQDMISEEQKAQKEKNA